MLRVAGGELHSKYAFVSSPSAATFSEAAFYLSSLFAATASSACRSVSEALSYSCLAFSIASVSPPPFFFSKSAYLVSVKAFFLA